MSSGAVHHDNHEDNHEVAEWAVLALLEPFCSLISRLPRRDGGADMLELSGIPLSKQ